MKPENKNQDLFANKVRIGNDGIVENQDCISGNFGPDDDAVGCSGPPPLDLRKRFPYWRKLGIVLLCLFVLGILCLLLLPPFHRIHWVGSKDLEITFVVTDAEDGLPLADAKVKILDEETSFCSNRGKAPFDLVTGPDGTATHLCEHAMCFGTEGWSLTGRIDTFAIHLPGWMVGVEAPGYAPTEPFYLDTGYYQRQVQRGTALARLKVPIILQKAQDAKNRTRND